MPQPASPPFEPASLVGTTLDGRYVLSAHLATGGMGAVFRAHHIHLRKDFAVKVLRPDLTGSPDIVERFRREAEIASALEHDNIVRVTDFGRSESGYLFLVMELLTGESLFERLRREGFIAPEEAVPILWQICAALEAAHEVGVIHRDLKPENVFLARSASGREVAKILDFGIAKIADPRNESDTQAGVIVGTPEYLSPEQATGAPVDARADVYTVGLIAWRMLAGRHPFKAEDARSLLMMQATRPVPMLSETRPDLAALPALVAAVAKACAKDPEARHASAAALKNELAVALGPSFLLPPGATPAPSLPRVLLSPPRVALPTPERPYRGPTLRSDQDTPPLQPWPLTPLPVAPRWTSSRPRSEWSDRARKWLAAARARLVRAGEEIRRSPLVLRARDRGRDVARRAAAHVRSNPPAWALAGAGVVLVAIVAVTFAWREGRPAAQARALLASDRAADARAVLDNALERRPEDRELLLLRGRALHRIPGRAGEGVEAYASARAHGPLDEEALDDLVDDLGRERNVADKATRLLRDEGDHALARVLHAAAGSGRGVQRLRALTLARDLGSEERVDRIQAYAELLADTDCEVRRAAARRLGEIGDPAAVPPLRSAAEARIEARLTSGRTVKGAACGAADADAAVRRIDAARLPEPKPKPKPKD